MSQSGSTTAEANSRQVLQEIIDMQISRQLQEITDKVRTAIFIEDKELWNWTQDRAKQLGKESVSQYLFDLIREDKKKAKSGMSGQVSLDRSLQDRKPTRVSLTIGSTTRLNEFDFSKVAVSLERDLAPAENPLDAYRDVNALLRRALSELQAGPKTPQTSDKTPTLSTSKPPSLTIELLHERLTGWLPNLEITSGFDGFNVKPKRYLGESWQNVNEVVRSLGGKWIRGQKPADGAWRISK